MMNKRNKNCLRKILFAILATSLFYYANAIAQSAGDAWENAGTLSSKRASCQAHAIDDTIYLIGGVEDSTAVAKVEAYDPVSQIWTVKANLTESRMMFASCSLNGKIYVMGGEAQNGQANLNSVEVYDLQADVWTVLAPMNVGRSHFSACAVNGKIYAVGGVAGDSAIDAIEEYDPITDSWTLTTTVPNPRHGSAACVVDNKIIIIGGQTSKQGLVLDTVDEYDPQLDTWTTKAALLKPRTAISLCLLDKTVYAIGGMEWDGLSMNLSQLNERYNPDNDTWERMANLPTAGSLSFAVCSYNGRIYTFGGHLGSLGNSTDYIRAYTPPPPHLENQWRIRKNMQIAHGKTPACVINGKMYVVGNGTKTEEYNPQTNSWRYVKDMPISRNGSDACALNNLMYVTGGQTGMGQPGLTSLHCYDPITNQWATDAAQMPVGQYVLDVCACAGKLYAGCGLYHARDLAEYDPVLNVWKKIKDVPALETTALCGHNGILYTFGGAQGMQKVYAYNPTTETWEQKADMPTGRVLAATCFVNDLIYVIGGTKDPSWPWDDELITSVVEAYDPIRNEWHTGYESMPTPRFAAGACLLNETIYVAGGRAKGSDTNVLEAYKPLATKVTEMISVIPSSSLLKQNYPNPFNPATTIEYSLPHASFVTLKVFDLLGREVRILVQEQQAAGAHSVLFEAGELPSNLYFYKLEWDGACEIRKMALVR